MIRDKSFIKANIQTKDKKIIVTQNTIIEFPKRYLDKKLAVMDKRIYVYGIFAIIMGDKYSVSLIPGYLETTPLLIKEVIKDGIEYVQFHYGKNLPIIENTTIIRNKILTYSIFEEFYLKANIPWFIQYEDLNTILSNMKYYADSDIGKNNLTNEVVTSYITRDAKNKQIYYRLSKNKEYTYVSLDDIYYSTIGTLAKIGGSYMTDGLVSALVQPEKSPTKLEEIVRK